MPLAYGVLVGMGVDVAAEPVGVAVSVMVGGTNGSLIIRGIHSLGTTFGSGVGVIVGLEVGDGVRVIVGLEAGDGVSVAVWVAVGSGVGVSPPASHCQIKRKLTCWHCGKPMP